jgi:hypothetical protein
MQHSMPVKQSPQTGVEVEESSFINANNPDGNQSFEQEPVGLYAAVRLKNLTKVTNKLQMTKHIFICFNLILAYYLQEIPLHIQGRREDSC